MHKHTNACIFTHIYMYVYIYIYIHARISGLVLSSKPHAKIISIDTSTALSMEGVVAYIDHKDVDGDNDHGAVIFDEEVCSCQCVYGCLF
jgi:xanthine dehydrogenase molybdopterin-binding subunit B